MNLKEAYLAGHKACGLKVGDRVKVMRAAEKGEQGWQNTWSVYAGGADKNQTIGNVYEIIQDNLVKGFILDFDSNAWHFPWFILEKVEDAIKTSDLDFGCQQENVEILVSRIVDYMDSRLKGKEKK
jgi:hypothetical protein